MVLCFAPAPPELAFWTVWLHWYAYSGWVCCVCCGFVCVVGVVCVLLTCLKRLLLLLHLGGFAVPPLGCFVLLLGLCMRLGCLNSLLRLS